MALSDQHGFRDEDRIAEVASQMGSPAYWVSTDDGDFIYTDKSFQQLEGWYRAQYMGSGIALQGGAGTLFGSQEEAAIDWGLRYSDNTLQSGKELGSSIYQVGNKFAYTKPRVGSDLEVDPSPAPSVMSQKFFDKVFESLRISSQP